MTKSTVLYARVSSERQAQHATIDSQLVALRERARHDGRVVLPHDEYIDNGYSGSTLRRPALERLRDRVAEGAVDVLYVHHPDRLARRHAHQVLLLDECAARGVRVILLHGRSGESAEDHLLTQVQGVIAEYERAKIMERSRRGKLHKARVGSINVLSSAPYGYLYVKKSDRAPAHYQVVLHEARVVRRIFDAVVREHQTLRAVAARLEQERVPPRRGATLWRATAIRAVLRNPSYMGEAAFGKTECVERAAPLRRCRGRPAAPKRLKNGYRARPPAEWIRIAVPPIVSADTFAAAQVQLERNRVFAERHRAMGRYLLSGLCVCTRCGYGYYGRRTPSRRGSDAPGYLYYFCSASVRGQTVTVCHNRSVRLDQLEMHVWQSVCALLQDPTRVMNEWSRRVDPRHAQGDRDAQRDEALRAVRVHERTLQRLMDAYEAGVLDLAELTKRSERVRTRLTLARDDVAALDRVLAEERELQLVIGRLEQFAQRVRDGLDVLPWIERRAVIRALIARIEIDQDDVTIVYRIPHVASDSAPGPVTPTPSDPFVDCVHGARTP